MSLDDFIIRLRFFLPSKALTKTILELHNEFLRQHDAELPKTSGTARILEFLRSGARIEQQQRVIAERLYGFLASVARNSKDEDEVLYIWDWIPHGMAESVGFPAYADIQVRTDVGIRALNALKDLTAEFRDWLMDKRGSYQAAWGEMQMLDRDRLRLVADPQVHLEHKPTHRQEEPTLEPAYEGSGPEVHLGSPVGAHEAT